jgi:hypothetical protein
MRRLIVMAVGVVLLAVAGVAVAGAQEFRDVAAMGRPGQSYRVPIERFAGVPGWAAHYTPTMDAQGVLWLYTKLEDGTQLYVIPPPSRPAGEVREAVRPIGDAPAVIPNGVDVRREFNQAPGLQTNDPETWRELGQFLDDDGSGDGGQCPNGPDDPDVDPDDDDGRRSLQGLEPGTLLGVGLAVLAFAGVIYGARTLAASRPGN